MVALRCTSYVTPPPHRVVAGGHARPSVQVVCRAFVTDDRPVNEGPTMHGPVVETAASAEFTDSQGCKARTT